MTVRPFIAILPKQSQIGDEVILKGKIKNDALVFSVNFAMDCSPNPSNIAYHFKTNFNNNQVVHNYKTDGAWNMETVEDNTWIQGPGSEFILTFHFDDNEILVYSDDEDRCFQYKFENKFNINNIKSVQVWDDVESVDEIIFRYRKSSAFKQSE